MSLDLRSVGPLRQGSCGFVLLPGIEGSGGTFASMVGLGQHAPVWTVDWPDSGTIRSLGRALADALPPGRHLLVGASFGGLVGRAAAGHRPEQVATLVGIGSLPGRHHRPALVRAQAALVGSLPAAAFSRLYHRRIRARLEEEGVGLERAAVHLAALPSRDALTSRLRAVADWDPGPAPAALTWWIRGQNDREARWTSEAAQAVLPEASVQTVPGGHRPWLTHEGALSTLLLHLRTNAVALGSG